MKERIDVLIFEKGLAPSREMAKRLVMEGQVYIGEQRIDKPGTSVDTESEITVRETAKYVSRGGLKLEKAIDVFGIDLKNKNCMDIGASTGGFTDCMLQNGAAYVYSVDVGYGQLAWKLRTDERVSCIERTNIRYFDTQLLKHKIEFVSIDVSFISLKLVLPKVKEILEKDCFCAALVKPQFEAGREKVGKKGVVRDIKVHEEVLRNAVSYATELGFSVKQLDFSPIKGPEGNIEYLMYIKNDGLSECADENILKDVISKSHQHLSTEGNTDGN